MRNLSKKRFQKGNKKIQFPELVAFEDLEKDVKNFKVLEAKRLKKMEKLKKKQSKMRHSKLNLDLNHLNDNLDSAEDEDSIDNNDNIDAINNINGIGNGDNETKFIIDKIDVTDIEIPSSLIVFNPNKKAAFTHGKLANLMKIRLKSIDSNQVVTVDDDNDDSSDNDMKINMNETKGKEELLGFACEDRLRTFEKSKWFESDYWSIYKISNRKTLLNDGTYMLCFSIYFVILM